MNESKSGDLDLAHARVVCRHDLKMNKSGRLTDPFSHHCLGLPGPVSSRLDLHRLLRMFVYDRLERARRDSISIFWISGPVHLYPKPRFCTSYGPRNFFLRQYIVGRSMLLEFMEHLEIGVWLVLYTDNLQHISPISARTSNAYSPAASMRS